MIDDSKIKVWARGKILGAGFDSTAFAWVNEEFDSSDLSIFYRERYAVADEGINGVESNIKTGLLFYDVIVNRGSGGDISDSSAHAIAELFEPADNKMVEIESGLSINIDSATTGVQGPYEESKFLTPVTIEFRSFETSP